MCEATVLNDAYYALSLVVRKICIGCTMMTLNDLRFWAADIFFLSQTFPTLVK